MVHTYGTNMQQSVWQLFPLKFLFKTKFLWKQETVQKGREWEDRLSTERQLKYIAKNSNFIQNILLTLRVYKKMFYWVWVNIYTSFLPKKQYHVCSVSLQCISLLFLVCFSINFPRKVNKAIVTTQIHTQYKHDGIYRFLNYRGTVQNY